MHSKYATELRLVSFQDCHNGVCFDVYVCTWVHSAPLPSVWASCVTTFSHCTHVGKFASFIYLSTHAGKLGWLAVLFSPANTTNCPDGDQKIWLVARFSSVPETKMMYTNNYHIYIVFQLMHTIVYSIILRCSTLIMYTKMLNWWILHGRLLILETVAPFSIR